ncbi:acyl-CoA dehydrogenase family protein [Thaumasiovibrio sp. DFM-14]|uniref:acyl-CoA dehydrogenase family protein n=1 Tax=Thaumasiovibrio sp. DFM-14 TaxID=3384792 RepID=UPI0039A24FD5
MDFCLTEEQLALQEAARQFADTTLAPFAAAWDEQSVFPREALSSAGKMGFLGLYSPVSSGGLGLTRLDACLIFEALAKGCTSTTAYMTIHNMVTWMIATYGRSQALQPLTASLVTGEKLGSYCLTEAEAGSDAGALKTKAISVENGFHLTGSKAFISAAGDSDVLLVMAREEDGRISAFVVDADAQGISYGRKEPKMGWHSQATRTVNFEKVFVSTAFRLGDGGDGFHFAMQGLDGGRLNIAACSLGTAQQALRVTRDYVQQRQQFGQRLADFQTVQFRLADMTTDLVAARQLLYWAAWTLDNHRPEATAACAMAKRYVTDVGFQVCDQALQLFGGYGYIKEYPLERYFRDTRVHQILEGTNEIMRLIIARDLLGKHDHLL